MQWIAVALLCVVRTAEVDGLVECLQAPDFQVREAAAAKIERLGSWAVLGLERGLRHQDPEVRQRCARLLELARRSALEVRLAALLDDPDHAEAKRLPGWERFRKRYGDDYDARSVFVAMTRDVPNLGCALEIRSHSTPEQTWKALDDVLGQSDRGNRLGWTASYMFVALEEPRLKIRTTASPYRFLVQLHHHADADSAVFRRLTTDFFRHRHTAFSFQELEDAAEKLHLDELTDRVLKPDVRRLAAILSTEPPYPAPWVSILNLADRFGMEEIRERFLAAELPRLLQSGAVQTAHRRELWFILARPEIVGRPDAQAFALAALRSWDPRGQTEDHARAILFFHQLGRRDVADEVAALLTDHTDFYGVQVRHYAAGFLLWCHGREAAPFEDHQRLGDALERWRRCQAERQTAALVNHIALRANTKGTALLHRLGSDIWTEREEAAERLRQLGPQATPLLKAGREDADPEVAERCRRLLVR